MSHKATVQIIADKHLTINGEEISIHDIDSIVLNEDGQPDEYRVKQGKKTISVHFSLSDKISGHEIIAMEVKNNRMMELLKDASMVLHAVTTDTSFKFDNLHKKIREELNRNVFPG